jgi:hypothetical protein
MTTDNFCFYLQNRLIQTSQTGGQWYSDTSPFSIPWCLLRSLWFLNMYVGNVVKVFEDSCVLLQKKCLQCDISSINLMEKSEDI